MVETKQVIKMSRDWKEGFKDEMEELNEALEKMEINCKVSIEESPDSETLIFEKE